MINMDAKRVTFLKQRILTRLDELRPHMSNAKYKLYISMVNDCNSFEEIREMAELDMQFNMLNYIKQIEAKLKLSDTNIEELEAVTNQNIRATKLTIIKPKKIEKSNSQLENDIDFSTLGEDLEDENVLASIANILMTRINNTPVEELYSNEIEYNQYEDIDSIDFEEEQGDNFESDDENDYNEDDDENSEREENNEQEENKQDINNIKPCFDNIIKDEDSILDFGIETKEIKNNNLDTLELEESDSFEFEEDEEESEDDSFEFEEDEDDEEELEDDSFEFEEDEEKDDSFEFEEDTDSFEFEEDEDSEDESNDNSEDKEDSFEFEEEEESEEDSFEFEEEEESEEDSFEFEEEEESEDEEDSFEFEEEDNEDDSDTNSLDNIDANDLFSDLDETTSEEDLFDLDESDFDFEEPEDTKNDMKSLFNSKSTLPKAAPAVKRELTIDKVFINGTKRGEQTQQMFNIINSMFDGIGKIAKKKIKGN